MAILKRDGSVQEFDVKKIEMAVMKAMIASGSPEIDASNEAFAVGVEIEAVASGEEMISVAEIHTLVENALMDHCQNDAARAYIEYRKTRDNNREAQGKLYKDVQGFLEHTCDEFTKENANKPTKLVHTHRDLLAGILSKHMAVTQILPEKIMKAHTDGFMHVHDLDYIVSPLTNCCLVNYPDMLEHGFNLGGAKIETPKSIGVACTILSQIALGVSGAQYGGQTHSHIDTGLKPYVEASFKKNLELVKELTGVEDKDKAMALTDKEVYDSMQTLLYQVNTMSSTNGQSPFITISLGLDTSVFGRMITRNYLKVHKAGLGKDHVTPVFPKVLFFLEEGVNMKPGDPNYDLKRLALECSADRIYPDFVSVPLNRKVTGSTAGDVTSMGKLKLLM